MVARSRIARYWFDKGINKDTFEVVQVTKDTNFDKIEIVVWDWGEPECWACGKPVKINEAENLSISAIWNSCKLQRCHIIAKQFGGSYEPPNQFLLCPKCHRDSPDTMNPKNFYAWILHRRKNGGYIQDIVKGLDEACIMKHIDDTVLLEAITKMKFEDEEFRTQFVKKLKNISGFHGASIADSTLFLNIIDIISENI